MATVSTPSIPVGIFTRLDHMVLRFLALLDTAHRMALAADTDHAVMLRRWKRESRRLDI